MKSIIVDEDVHYLLKCIALKNKKNIKDSVHESIIDIAKKYNVDVPPSLKMYEVKHK